MEELAPVAADECSCRADLGCLLELPLAPTTLLSAAVGRWCLTGLNHPILAAVPQAVSTMRSPWMVIVSVYPTTVVQCSARAWLLISLRSDSQY